MRVHPLEVGVFMTGKLRQSVKRVSTAEIYRVQKAPVLIAYGTVAIEEAVVLARDYVGPEAGMIVAGITRQGNPKRWYFGVSFKGERFEWIAIHRLLTETEDQIATVVDAARGGRIGCEADMAALIGELAVVEEDAISAD